MKPILITMHSRDTVAVVGNPGGLPAGTAVEAGFELREAVSEGHKVALTDIPAGAPIFRYGEVIGYHLNQDIKSRNIEEVIEEIKDQGGRVSVPHPFDSVRKSTIRREKLNELINKFDFLEGLNARSLWFYNQRAKRFAADNSIPALGGSDAHTKNEIGTCYTVFGDVERMEIKSIQNNANIFHPAYYLLRTKAYKIFKI